MSCYRLRRLDEKSVVNNRGKDLIDSGANLDVSQLLLLLWNHKFRIFFLMLASLAGALYLTSKLTPYYETTATILVDVDQANVTNIASVQSDGGFDKDTLLTEVQVLGSSRLLNNVIAELQLQIDPEFNSALVETSGPTFSLVYAFRATASRLLGSTDAAATPDPDLALRREKLETLDNLREAVTFTPVVGSKVIKVSARADDPVTAAAIANTISRNYIDDKALAYRAKTQNAVAWLETYILDLGAEVNEAEANFEKLREQLSAEAGQSIENTESQMQLLNGSITNATVRAAELEAQYRQQSSYLEQGNLDAILVGSQAFRSRERREEAERIVLVLANELDAANKEVEIVREKMRKLEEQTAFQRKRQLELTQLERRAASSRRLYETMLTRAQEIDAQNNLQPIFAQLISPADIPINANTTREKLILVFSVLFGLGAALVSIVLQRALNSKVIDITALQSATKYEIIGRLPKTKERSLKKMLVSLVANQDSNFSDAIRRLRNRLLPHAQPGHRPARVMMFTSSIADEGKTTCSLAFAMACRNIALKAIIVDCDIRRANTQLAQFVASPHSLADFLVGDVEMSDIVSFIEGTDVTVIRGIDQTGYDHPGGSDILSYAGMDALIASLRKVFDVVILDVAPSVLFPDSEMLAKYTNDVVYVVKWGSTPLELVTQGVAELEKADAPIAGIVVNQINEGKAAQMTQYQNVEYYRTRYN